jgi:hypothetical protein
MPKKTQNLFQRLTTLFRSGPVVKRKVRNFSEPAASTALELFRRAHSDVYNSTLSAYGAFDRMSRYSDFSEMEATPEIASALDIYSEETASPDEKGRILHVYSENERIKDLLDNLFCDILNIEFNLVMWIRNLCKYGDFFLFNDISPEFGIINVFPIAISEMEREENFDPNNPAAVRFRWITQGNTVLESWQVTHFRLLGNDAFLPYGTSVLESARRIWRQLILIEDAMLVYRVIRAPERRVFYIDVGNVPPENVADYLEQAQTSLKRSQVINKDNGQVDLRYNPLSVDEDYFLPVRGGESGTRIDTLAGGQNTAAIEDVEYIQKKLFAALKIPRAYLGYDEDTGSKATLAQEDIRFSRGIQRIQKTVIAELNKVAMIHLYCHGYDGEDLIDFELKLSNPSSVAQQQKLELIRARFEIAGTAPEGMVDKRWIRKNVMGLTDLEIEDIEEGRVTDKIRDQEVEGAVAEAPPGGAGGEPAPPPGEEGGGEDDALGLFSGDATDGELLVGYHNELEQSEKNQGENDEEELEDEIPIISIDDITAPAKVEKQIRNVFNEPIKKSRKVRGGRDYLASPDFVKMTSVGKPGRKQDSFNDPMDVGFLSALGKFNESEEKSPYEEFLDEKIGVNAKMTQEMARILNNLGSVINIEKGGLLSEDAENDSDEMLSGKMSLGEILEDE